MDASTPDGVIEILDEAFGRGDLETILRFYEDEAVVIPEPGIVLRGIAEIGAFYRDAMRPGVAAVQERTHVMAAGGIALFTSRWTAHMPGEPPRSFVSNVVLRAQATGGWKVLLDNARGPMVLDPAA